MVRGDIFVRETLVSGDAFPVEQRPHLPGKGARRLGACGLLIDFFPSLSLQIITNATNQWQAYLQAIKSSYPPSLSWFSHAIFALFHLADEDFDEPKRGTTIPK
jgi:hypothetical protein